MHGGSGIVAAGRVGSLQIDVSTSNAILAFAGAPNVSTSGKTLWPGVPKYRALGYDCSNTTGEHGPVVDLPGCRTVYYVNLQTGRLAAFSTRSQNFHTTNGITPGMNQSAADRLEQQTPHGPWNGIGETSPAANLILPSTCHRMGNGPCRGKVDSFMLESRHHPIGLLFT